MVDFEREKILMGFKGVWRGFHMVSHASLHLSTITLKVCLEGFFGKKMITLVAQLLRHTREGEGDSKFSTIS
ncbi:hypothetical protein MA16_Dca017038 [Dendrobium catenatum]|uniref:Uncharacterized protein n=1 Tax=Dendrobium catenatum TaxID=906689 RepID=A0A2I0V9H7_9ASPA|nr:hypothetical protein MA16_Dca017038 [Dendrobium catenatum]